MIFFNTKSWPNVINIYTTLLLLSYYSMILASSLTVLKTPFNGNRSANWWDIATSILWQLSNHVYYLNNASLFLCVSLSHTAFKIWLDFFVTCFEMLTSDLEGKWWVCVVGKNFILRLSPVRVVVEAQKNKSVIKYNISKYLCYSFYFKHRNSHS